MRHLLLITACAALAACSSTYYKTHTIEFDHPENLNSLKGDDICQQSLVVVPARIGNTDGYYITYEGETLFGEKVSIKDVDGRCKVTLTTTDMQWGQENTL